MALFIRDLRPVDAAPLREKATRISSAVSTLAAAVVTQVALGPPRKPHSLTEDQRGARALPILKTEH
ncbi:MAG: hypothetical protein WBA53_18725 [Burkholderiaceae bacterium]